MDCSAPSHLWNIWWLVICPQPLQKFRPSDFSVLTHSGRDKMVAILQPTFSSAFSSMKVFQFGFKFHWSLLLRAQLTVCQHWFRWWLGTKQATGHYLDQWLPFLLTHIFLTRPQWVNLGTIQPKLSWLLKRYILPWGPSYLNIFDLISRLSFNVMPFKIRFGMQQRI